MVSLPVRRLALFGSGFVGGYVYKGSEELRRAAKEYLRNSTSVKAEPVKPVEQDSKQFNLEPPPPWTQSFTF